MYTKKLDNTVLYVCLHSYKVALTTLTLMRLHLTCHAKMCFGFSSQNHGYGFLATFLTILTTLLYFGLQMKG